MKLVINNQLTAKTALSQFIFENRPKDIDEKSFITEQLKEWEDEKALIEREIWRVGAVNNYKIDKAIDLYFLIEAGKEIIK